MALPRPIPEGDLDYARKLVTLALLVVLVPLVVHFIFTRPGEAAKHALGAVTK